MITDLFKSIFNNLDTKIKNPLIGAYLCAWFLCNWYQLIILAFGSKTIEDRINTFHENLTVSNYIAYPLLATLLYLFTLPILNYWVQLGTNWIEIKRHKTSVELDITKQKQQQDLNKEKFKANPDNGYIRDEIALEHEKKLANIEIEKTKIKTDKEESKKRQLENEEKEENIKKQKNQNQKDAQDNERQKHILDREKQRRELEIKRHQASLANYRFPVIFNLYISLNQALKNQDILIDITDLSELLCIIFGYTSMDLIFTDTNFNHDNLNSTKYILLDYSGFDEAIQNRLSSSLLENIDSSLIIETVKDAFEAIDIKILSVEDLNTEIIDFMNDYDVITSQEFCDATASTNAFFDEQPEFTIDETSFEHGQYIVNLSGQSSGEQHEDKPFSGDCINVTSAITLDNVLGTNAYSSIAVDLGAEVMHQDDYE